MRKSFADEIMAEYLEYLPDDVTEECQKLATYLAFRFAIPADEVPNLCRMIDGTDSVEQIEMVSEEIYSVYRFYISEPCKGAIGYILREKDLPLIETKNGLRDEKQRTITRIRSTKKEEGFQREQICRMELIEDHLTKVLTELEFLQTKQREKFNEMMQSGQEWLS